jgi:hypothetical protein
VPEFTNGTIASVIETSDGVAITVDQVKSEDFKSYLEQIKNSFTQDTAEASADDSYTYIAANADGIQVSLYYASESLMISVAKPIE